jgi:hypothetical protein
VPVIKADEVEGFIQEKKTKDNIEIRVKFLR